MKIVIDIPEKVNNRIRSYLGHGYCIRDEDVKIIAEAIYNGHVMCRPYPMRGGMSKSDTQGGNDD